MTLDLDRITQQINALWDVWAPVLIVATAVAVLGTAAIVLWSLWRRANAKKTIGFAVVQAGVTYAVITGVYEFFHLRLDMPVIEAILLAIFIEGAVWGAVGFIVAHGRSQKTGFGDAGGLFWFAQTGGGLLAVLGSPSTAVAIGRVVIVALGGYMWYIQLLQVTQRSGKPARWRWTPKRLLLAVGALAPEDNDIEDEAREWQVRRIARAMRWANSRWPWTWLGGRALARRAETTTEDVLSEARRRFAAAWVLREQSKVTSETMSAVVDEAERAAKFAAMRPDTIAANWPAMAGEVTGQKPDAAAASDRAVAGQSTASAGQSGRSKPAAVSGQRRSSKRQRLVEKAADAVAGQPDISGTELLKVLRMPSKSERTGRRLKQEAEAFLAAAGRAVTDPACSNGHADIDPAEVAALAAAADRT